MTPSQPATARLDQRFPARPSALRATWLASLKEGGRNVVENAATA